MKRCRYHKETGFTLVELLVTVTILAVLASLALAGVNAALDSARKTEEVASARTLIQAYLNAAVSNGGRYVAGYDRTVNELELSDGRMISGPAASRYPYRMAAFMEVPVEDLVLVGKNAGQVDAGNDYEVSLYPAFGINHIFVGGDVQADGSVSFEADCVTTMARASSSPLVFATSGSTTEAGEVIHGFNIVSPPNTTSSIWSADGWEEGSDPGDYGNLHARYRGKVIAAFLDGSVRQHTIRELDDMRLWSVRAKAKNDPDYRIPRRSSGGGGRL